MPQIADHPTEEEKAKKAVKIIADARKSQKLWTWLETGTLGDTAMDTAEAYSRLRVDDHTVNDDLISTAYQVCVSDDPSAAAVLRQALQLIAEERQSARLLQMAGISQNTEAPVSSDWPVGLQNIGNTCYLNSLLQFFFTVSGLRELVLHFEHFKMELTDENVAKKKVSSRKVDAKEIERSQICKCRTPLACPRITRTVVIELGKLFHNMITSPESSVKPDLQLAKLALVASRKEDTIRRESIVRSDRPNLGTMNGLPISGPVGPPPRIVPNDEQLEPSPGTDFGPASSQTNHAANVQDNSSEGTLVSHVTTLGDEDILMTDATKVNSPAVFANKENFPPGNKTSSPQINNNLQPLRDSSPSRINTQAANDITSNDAPLTEEPGTVKDSKDAVPPSRPPIPPRPKANQSPPTATLEEVEYGAQQDVSEVIENVLFQLSSAIKPTSVDPDGEQSDQIKKLFWGRQKSTIVSPNGDKRDSESIFHDVRVNVVSGPQDIYTALDGAFDAQNVEVGSSDAQQYSSITQVPPILQVCVQRAQWDRMRKENVKSNNHLDLRETIYLDRYLSGGEESDVLQRRKQAWSWKQERAELEGKRQKLAVTEVRRLCSQSV